MLAPCRLAAKSPAVVGLVATAASALGLQSEQMSASLVAIPVARVRQSTGVRVRNTPYPSPYPSLYPTVSVSISTIRVI